MPKTVEDRRATKRAYMRRFRSPDFVPERVNLAELTAEQRRLVLALIEMAKAAQSAGQS